MNWIFKIALFFLLYGKAVTPSIAAEVEDEGAIDSSAAGADGADGAGVDVLAALVVAFLKCIADSLGSNYPATCTKDTI